MSGPPIDPDAFRAAFAALKARLDFLEEHLKLFVPDADLDKPRGDLKLNFDPKGWRGPSFKGKRASEASPEFLETYASALSWFAANPKPGDDPKKAGYNRTDAARCRTWARRLRALAAKAAAEAEAAQAERELLADDPFAVPAVPPSDKFIVGRESAELFDDSHVDHTTLAPGMDEWGEPFAAAASAPEDNPFDSDDDFTTAARRLEDRDLVFMKRGRFRE